MVTLLVTSPALVNTDEMSVSKPEHVGFTIVQRSVSVLTVLHISLFQSNSVVSRSPQSIPRFSAQVQSNSAVGRQTAYVSRALDGVV